MSTERPVAGTPRVDRSVVGLLVADFSSAAAAMAQATVLGKLVYDLTSSKLDLGLLGLAEFAPAAFLALLSGAVADRFDRRRFVAVGVVGEAMVAALLTWYVGTKPTSVVPIFGMVLLFGAARAFSSPAARSLPANMVAPEHLPWLVARSSAAWQAAIIAGPVLGGFLYTIDIRLPFVAVAGLLVVAAPAALVVRTLPAGGAVPMDGQAAGRSALLADAAQQAAVEPVVGHPAAAGPTRGGLHDAMEGLRFVRAQPVLLGAISLDLFAVLFGGAVALLPAIAKDQLHVGAVGLGWLRAAGGIGAGAMTLVLAVRPLARRVGHILLSVVAVFGVWTIVLGVTRSFALAFIAMVALSAADAVSVFIRATLVPLITPDEKRGRVLAIENVFIGASNELGAFESGVAGQLLGTSAAVVLGGVATLAVAGSWAVLFPGLREVDHFPDATASAGGPLGAGSRSAGSPTGAT
jgi:predicted MFS family arabinose efflux permease